MNTNGAEADQPYAAAVQVYCALGWPSVLPIPAPDSNGHNGKWPPPAGFTGRKARTPSADEMSAWANTKPAHNVALHMSENLAEVCDGDWIVGVDVDGYKGDPGKTGADTMTEAQRRWGELEPTWRSTSRVDDPVSGIYFYRVPAGIRLQDVIKFGELGLGNVEIVQPHHRYAITWPSIHGEGRRYMWLGPAAAMVDSPPAPAQITARLPQAWIDALQVLEDSAGIKTSTNGEVYDVDQAITSGPMTTRVVERLNQAISDCAGGSRHDAVRDHVLVVLRYGRQGDTGVKAALTALEEAFVDAITPDRGDRVARKEWHNLVYSKRVAEELAVDDIADVCVMEGPATDDSDSDSDIDVDEQPDAQEPVASIDQVLPGVEEDFWTSRQSLTDIYEGSLARMCSPWGVLVHCVARALAAVPPCITLPPLIGGPGSLNWFGAVVAKSGGGKGGATAVARDLVPYPITVRNLGSGEGLVDAYCCKQDDAHPTGRIESVMFLADEVDTVAVLGNRQGATLISVLRSAFFGETLGFSYRGNNSHLDEHSYRLTLVVSVQPGRAGWILGDAHGGTPQRFLWFPGSDARVTKTPPEWKYPVLRVPGDDAWPFAMQLTVPEETKELVLTERAKNARGEQDALDGHAVFSREKFALGLALLDGRAEMTSEDWRLSGIAAAVSDHTRRWALQEVRLVAEQEAVERGRQRGIANHAARQSEEQRERENANRVRAWIVAQLTAAGEAGMTEGELRKAAPNRDRSVIKALLGGLAQAGYVKKIDRLGHDRSDRWVVVADAASA
jgi:hypothetical protein